MPSLSKLAEKCQKCKYKDDCNEKRMVACAYLKNPPILAEASAEMTAPLMQPIMVKHDYRDIKISEGTTITIDLEEIKERLEKDAYRALGCPGLNFGA